MVRIRLYGLLLSLPIIVVLIGFAVSFFADTLWLGIPAGWLRVMSGIALQAFFGLTMS
jgi:hypothetical protein